MKKKWVLFGLTFLLIVASLGLAGCGSDTATSGDNKDAAADQAGTNSQEVVTIKVGATPVPHSEILENVVKPLLEEEGVKLEVITYQDYVLPNQNLNDKEIDANFFQHIPYLEDFSAKHNLAIDWAAKVHLEPMGIYSKKVEDLNQVKDGAKVAVPNDPSNLGRALLLLEKADLLTLKEGAGIAATELDITDSKVSVVPMDAAMLPRNLEDVELAVINTNFAIPAGLNPLNDALFLEEKDSPYANVLAIRKGDETRPEIEKLINAITSEDVAKYINEKYDGAILPAIEVRQ